MFSSIMPFQHIAIRLPSDAIKVEQIVPNSHINLGKFGTFSTNLLIGRPFHLTYEVLDRAEQAEGRQLRVVKAAELHADALLEEAESDLQNGSTPNAEFDEYGLQSTEKSNVAIFDNPENQKLTMAEIEALKADGSAKELISRIMASHAQLDQKTAFSLAKYTLRKQKKYMKRFTVLPLDVATLVDWITSERDFVRIMEIRNEALGLIGSWANVHAAENLPEAEDEESKLQSRYLVVDDTGGLVVAALAERMGILHNTKSSALPSTSEADEEGPEPTTHPEQEAPSEIPTTASNDPLFLRRHKQHYDDRLASSNTLTLVHSNQQPNLSLLRYFNFDPNLPPLPSTPNPHPLYTHLKPLSWLQLLDPAADTTYTEPPAKTPTELRNLKSNARSTYYRKRRRWARCKAIVDETRAGGFNALIVASYTNPTSILHRLIPLLAGGAQIVVYSAHVEPLLPLVDAYSTARRSAWLALEEAEREAKIGTTEFPVDPTLTLGFMLQTARVRRWQVLPGRTHPLMMGRGGAEGYVASATRVLPVKGKIEARGKQIRGKAKRRVGILSSRDGSGDGEDMMVVDSSEEAEIEAQESERKKARVEDGNEDDMATMRAE